MLSHKPKIVWVTVILIFATCLGAAFFKGYQAYEKVYRPGHALTNAALLITRTSWDKLENNKRTLEGLKQATKYYPDTIKSRSLYRAGEKVHKLTVYLYQKFLEDSTLTLNYSEENGYRIISYLNNTLNSQRLFQAEHTTSPAHATRVRKSLRRFLNLTAHFPKTEQTRQRYSRLLHLAQLPNEEFFNALFTDKKDYLLLAEFALIKSEVTAIEAEYLSFLGDKMEGFNVNWRNKTWVAYPASPMSRPEWPVLLSSPVKVKAGDTLRFTARLMSTIKFNSANKPFFSFPGGSIDSVADNSVAYVSYRARNLRKVPGSTNLQEGDNEFSMRVMVPSLARDTTFYSRYRYIVKPTEIRNNK